MLPARTLSSCRAPERLGHFLLQFINDTEVTVFYMLHFFVMFSHIILFLVVCDSAQARSHKSGVLTDVVQYIDEANVKAPVANEVCFTPGEPCNIKLIKFIQSAKESLDIAIFDINLDKLVHEILIQSKKVKVRILVDRREAKGRSTLVPLLLKAGANVRYGRQKGIMHNKFIIVDSKIMETGSFNYTNGAAFKNNENQVYLSTPEVVTKYKARFEKIWENGFTIN